MKDKKREIKAVIIVSVCVILYYVAYFGLIMAAFDGIWRYLLGIFPIILGALIIKVSKDRIKEIKECESDDISKY